MKIHIEATFTKLVDRKLMTEPLRGLLGARAVNALYDHGVDYVGDLIQLSTHQLRRMKGIGSGCLAQITAIVRDTGLMQGTQLTDWNKHRPRPREQRRLTQ